MSLKNQVPEKNKFLDKLKPFFFETLFFESLGRRRNGNRRDDREGDLRDTNSPYDDQHTEAVKFCLKTGFGFTRGLNCARAVNPDVHVSNY